MSEASDRSIGPRVRKAAAATFLFRSLTFRVIAFSTVWAVLALIVIATVISTLYRQASERGFDSLLSAHLFNLIGSVSATAAGQLTGSPDLGDLRFSEPNSGWYWSVEPVSGGLTGELHSISMTGQLPRRRRPRCRSTRISSATTPPWASSTRRSRCSRTSSFSIATTASRASA